MLKHNKDNKSKEIKSESKKKSSFKKTRIYRFLKMINNYFVGAWKELRLVRWPNRKATWAMTGAVVFFTVFLFVLILLLDAGFKYLSGKFIQ